MKYLDEYRDRDLVRILLERISSRITRPWTLMEICGGQTHSFMKSGLLELLPEEITLIHGPGCPVCVTPVELIDMAVDLSMRENVILASFGDMLRVPGTRSDLLEAKASGGDVRIVYSPLDAVKLATDSPEKQVVFFAVGFETSAPAVALAVHRAHIREISNFSLLVAHVRVPPAMEALLSAPDNRTQGFLAAGHVCTVMGVEAYIPIAEKFRLPVVVTGFEPVDLLTGIETCIAMLEEGRTGVENAYPRAVRREGNVPARKMLERVFEPCDRNWRGLGTLPSGGYRLKKTYAPFDAQMRFRLKESGTGEQRPCIAGEILTGRKRPPECPAFGVQCLPETPLGAPMVSSEGACAAYYRYRTHPTPA